MWCQRTFHIDILDTLAVHSVEHLKVSLFDMTCIVSMTSYQRACSHLVVNRDVLSARLSLQCLEGEVILGNVVKMSGHLILPFSDHIILSLLVEAGVGLAVFSTILLIYYSFSGREVSDHA